MGRILPLILFGVLAPNALPAQSSKPQLGKAPFNGVNARVTALRFFEGGATIPDSKQRVNTTKFDALTTRFIYLELELSYPPAPKRTPFQVDCRFEGPAGTGRDLKLSGTIEQAWTGSYHAQGVGSAERGQWAEGTYQVSCREEGQLIAATQLEVVKSAAAVRKLGAAVVQMHFYQSLDEHLPIETRRYSTRFDAGTARWIKTEFALVYPQVTAPTSFSVECAYVFPDKSVKRVTVERQIPVGWTGSVHAQGIEAGQAGSAAVWQIGKYSVSCWNNGEKMAEAAFEIFDSGTGNREPGTGGGRLRFYARKVGSSADPSYDTTFATGSYDSLYVEASVPVRVMADSTRFGCTVTDPAGITSGFGLKGGVMDKEKLLVARGPVGTLDPPRLRGSYRVDCRTGARGGVSGGFSVTGPPEVPALDARMVSVGLFAGEGGEGREEPGDEAVPDVVWSAAELKTLWVVALFDHPSAAGAGTAGYSCRVIGPRSVVLADTGPQQLTVTSRQRALILRQRLALLPRQRWVAGKYVMSCALSGAGGVKTTGGGAPLFKLEFELTR